MARIRTIKPEFPQSETIGSLSRDARLLFIQLWTIADDEGRGRGAIPVLAGALYPYDDDARGLLNSWLSELVEANCIVRYEHAGNTYFQITNWSLHQKIDKPTQSRFPSPNGHIAERQNERDVEMRIFSAIEATRQFAGRNVVDVQRQIRVGSSYLDIVIKTATETFVLEIKIGKITGADLGQVKRYCELVNGFPVIVGAGLSAKLSAEECAKSGVAIIAYDDVAARVIVKSQHIRECSITFDSVIEQQITLQSVSEGYSPDLGPRTKDQGPRTKDQTRANSRDADLAAFERFWSSWPHKVGKPTAEKAFRRVAGRVDEILVGVERYVRTKPHDRPWLNPATFLNNERWKDEPAPEPQSRAGPRQDPVFKNGFAAVHEAVSNGKFSEENDDACPFGATTAGAGKVGPNPFDDGKNSGGPLLDLVATRADTG